MRWMPGTSAINGKHSRYEACVGPIPGGHVLWRLRELGAAEQGTSPDEGRQLFLDDSPVGFFAARADGQLIYMNRSLRAVLGLGDDPRLEVEARRQVQVAVRGPCVAVGAYGGM